MAYAAAQLDASSSASEPDNTALFDQRFNDPQQWKVVKNVPIFDEHAEESETEEPGPDGKPVSRKVIERFDKASLERHAANCNALVASGNPPGLTLGHTKDEGEEKSQPETVGFGRNYRVVYSNLLKRHVILHDEYFRPNRYEEVSEYPYRSVERWRKGEYFKPVALLRREPRRNLGIVTYRAGNGDRVIRYSMKGSSMPDVVPPVVADPAAQNAPGATTPPAPPAEDYSALEPSDKDKHLHAKLMDHYFSDPSNCEKMKKYMAGGQQEPSAPETPAPAEPVEPSPKPDDPSKNSAATPSGSNVMPPTMPPTDKNKATVDVVRYQAELKAANDRIAALEKENRVERYGAVLDTLSGEGVQFDRTEELTTVQDFDQPAFEKHVAHMRKRYQRLPIGRVRQGELPEPMGSAPTFNREQMEKAHRYQAEHPGTSFWDAVEKTGGKPPDAVARG